MSTNVTVNPVASELGLELGACCECGQLVELTSLVTVSNCLYCPDCVERLFFECERCGEYEVHNEVCVVDGENWCRDCAEGHSFECSDCGQRFPDNDARCVGTPGIFRTICESCAEEYFTCERCGWVLHDDRAVWVGDEVFCERCADRVASPCTRCNEWTLRDHLTSVGDDVYCESCADYISYQTCDDCGHTDYEDEMSYSEEDDAWYCNGCYNRASTQSIRSYHHGPCLHFYGEGKYHLGVELEVDGGDRGDRYDSARRAIATMEDRVYCCEDGSLDTGFEIITHPHTYDEMKKLPWEQMMRELSETGWRGHDVDTAGLHVHISRTAFDSTDAIARLCSFFEAHWDFVTKFSRRKPEKLKSWAHRKGEYCEVVLKTKDLKGRVNSDGDRYCAVNTTNRNTVEIRVFKSTLKHTTLLAALELVVLLAERSNQITDEEADEMSVAEWLVGASDSFLDYCKGRKIDLATA